MMNTGEIEKDAVFLQALFIIYSVVFIETFVRLPELTQF